MGNEKSSPNGKNDNIRKIPPRVLKRNKELTANINDMISQMEISLYGITKKSDVSDISSKFNSIMQNELELITKDMTSDMNSFMSKLYNTDMKNNQMGFGRSIEDIFGTDNSSVMTYLSEVYKNRIVKYADIHEVSTQLIELREAIRIFRDTLTSSDLTDGKLAKSTKFAFKEDEGELRCRSIVEKMEKKFKLDNKIKNFIIPRTLEYGSYYVYVIPYKKLFADFAIKKQKKPNMFSNQSRGYMESVTTHIDELSDDEFIANMYTETYHEKVQKTADRYKDFDTDIKHIMEHITVSNDPLISIPSMYYGESTIEEYGEFFMEDSNTEEAKFLNAQKMDSGVYSHSTKSEKNIENEFADISDCYIKLIPPTKIIPLKLIDKVIGYYYIDATDVRAIDGVISSNMYMNRYDVNTKQRNIIDGLVDRIVAAFDKPFLKENIEFKELIAEAITYYDLNSKSIHFQFIPAEYIVEFKVNENEEGDGTSIVEDSLFYAKLYLIMLLFKIMSILLYSNDTKVNYIKTSGIDKNVANKIQDIIREKQNRQINLMDMMSYSNVIQKVGRGLEQYIPMGRGNDRGIETEILQGQDIQLNTELMEMLKTAYILGTGVPSAIMNYLNEADFAKSIETANTRFQGRVISAQLDFNEGLTRLYKMLCKYSTSMTDSDIEQLEYTLTPPKFANNNTKQDALNAFDTLKNFYLNLYIGEQKINDPAYEHIVREFTQLLARENLPALKFEEVDKLYERAQLNAKERELNPDGKNTDNIDNFDIPGM